MSEQTQPVLRVITADATDEEIAAIVAVLSSIGTSAVPEKKPAPQWAAHARRLRRPLADGALAHGRGGWRASGLPR
ncbi:MAG: acyl-CoA carboxylase subunit epsilon [Nocardioidaceae bacterium]|nr:acyl-CoA carboxylase subunit epsilon [Nocardioidaceae bacterium]